MRGKNNEKKWQKEEEGMRRNATWCEGVRACRREGAERVFQFQIHCTCLFS